MLFISRWHRAAAIAVPLHAAVAHLVVAGAVAVDAQEDQVDAVGEGGAVVDALLGVGVEATVPQTRKGS